ncbi:hypothetical protein BD324DRAFT_651597 [Kockovaella imperatae]|uniref:Zn(2)-C6 fungal-type domain-containing protein n=1 Tax=Kockovaella imperatae TaxID=4999 RepID=A0A1Y1UFP7_9TREE|nr:hypothetical protein BD324DRAFT_651597 [Kockovaella imperatae]ORX36357.1 hypothetical protein BD324DRAFT_651597 [Kockovaella imperatae]
MDNSNGDNHGRAKIKRTHARRSCNVCKIRKTRCELPDQMIPSSTTPLPRDKACHRCKTLSLVCIVDDKGRRRGLPRDSDGHLIAPKDSWHDDQGASEADLSYSQPGPSKKRSLGKNGRTDYDSKYEDHTYSPSSPPPPLLGPDGPGYLNQHGIDTLARGLSRHEKPVDLLHGIDPYPNRPSGYDLLAEFNFTPPAAEEMSAEKLRNTKLHGRPLELVAAMLGSVYGRKVKKLDLGRLVDDHVRMKLEPGVLSLKTHHPWLPSLSDLLREYDPKTCSEPASLLLALVIYLASTSIPSQTQQLRSTLIPLVTTLRSSVLLHVPLSLAAVQALQLLTFHAPFGTLPWEKVNYHSLSVGRGQLGSALSIHSALGSRAFNLHFDMDPILLWDNPQFWLWMCLVADQGRLVLEDETTEVRLPSQLSQAKVLVDRIMVPSTYDVWGNASSETDSAELVGKLGVCNRIVRLAAALDTICKFHQSLLSLADDGFHDHVAHVMQDLDEYNSQLRGIEQEHDHITRLLASTPTCSPFLTTAAQIYRQIGWRFESSRVVMHATRSLVSGLFLPGTPLSADGLPDNLNRDERVAYAQEQMFNINNMIKAAMHPTYPGVRHMREMYLRRGEFCEGLLVAFADIEGLLLFKMPTRPSVLDSPSLDQAEHAMPILPVVELCSLAVEGTKILMEMRAGQILVSRIYSRQPTASIYRLPTWFYLIKQVSEVMIRVANKFSIDELDVPTSRGAVSVHSDATGEDGSVGQEMVVLGCGNLIASMVRVTEDWTRQNRAELDRVNSNSETTQTMQTTQTNGPGASRSSIESSTTFVAVETPRAQVVAPPMGNQDAKGNSSSDVAHSIAASTTESGSGYEQSGPHSTPGFSVQPLPEDPGSHMSFNYLGTHRSESYLPPIPPPPATASYGQEDYHSTDYIDPNVPPQSSTIPGYNYQAMRYTVAGFPYPALNPSAPHQQQPQLQPLLQDQSDYAPTPLDFLVAQMFNYSYLPGPSGFENGGGS